MRSGVGSGIEFLKGHATENDFILLPDPDAHLDLTSARVRALTDRRRGLGADGVLRVVPTDACPEVRDQADDARWFMDYRNADGTKAEMCGNGARLFARYLLGEGMESSSGFHIATRGGPREVTVYDDAVAVEIGPATPISTADSLKVFVDDLCWSGTGVGFPNPHAVVFVADLSAIGSLDQAPSIEPSASFPMGANVEFVVERGPNHVEFRVHERGVGETRSCGTGACAVAWAHWQRASPAEAEIEVLVDVPGGRLNVRRRSDGRWILSGPSTVVARGELDRQWWKEVQ